ncbi:MAG: AMP-binding protein, partial [Acetanaerobacterium sp.]
MMEQYYQNFCRETFDDNGVLTGFEPICPEQFNFAYDVVDEFAVKQPDRRALVWCNEQGDERIFTFGELKDLSDRAAAVFARDGIKKGDRVMLILKRHYQFWYVITALMKLGAVVIPATNLLTRKDLVYRFQAAGVTAVVCTADGEVSSHVLSACDECTDVSLKYMVRGEKDGFVNLDSEIASSNGTFDRPATHVDDPMLLYFTSGTTGYPKMVIHDNSYAIGHIITAKHWQNIPGDGLHLTVSETGWGKAVWGKLFGQ